MSAQRVDVLAVMDRIEDEKLRDFEVESAGQIRQARAAVAELIAERDEGKRQWDRVAKALGADGNSVDDVFARADAVRELVEAARDLIVDLESVTGHSCECDQGDRVSPPVVCSSCRARAALERFGGTP